jgi:type I restriction enzyme, S subunit
MKIEQLGDIASKIGSGATPKGGQSSYKQEGISLIRSQNILDFQFSKKGLAFIDEKQAKKLNNVEVQNGDILFNITGDSIARTCLAPDDILPARVNQHVSIIRCKNGYDSSFVNYYLINLKPYLMQICGVGGTRNAFTKEALSQLPIRIPSNQVAIAKVLSDLDKKIELNNKIYNELEAMAKLIYDYWFVQFDFPDTNGKPYKSSGGKMIYSDALKREIPYGWEVKELSELIEFDRGISYESKDITEDGTPMINLNSFDLSGRYKHSGLKYFSGSYNENKICIPGDLVVAITDVTRNADIIGKSFTIPDLFDSHILISCDVAKIVPSNKVNKQFLESNFNSKHYHDYIKYFASGTLVLHLDLEGINWYKIPLPPIELLNKYSSLKQSFDEKMTLSTKENRKLSDLREWLLPMLMNGQVSVKYP